MMHIFSMKAKTKKLAIQTIPDTTTYYLPLSQHIGLPATPIVSEGDRVLKYQLIAEAAGMMSANIHAPVSGFVKSIEKHPVADGTLVDTIVLENDFENTETVLTPKNEESITADDILQVIRESGIVGEGGAQFPTAVKYNLQGAKIETFIVNGTECEPYLTSDFAVMREYTADLFRGIGIVDKILRADEIVLSIEEQNRDLLPIFDPFLKKAEYKKVRVVVLPNQYPQGGELQLIKSVTGKELPKGSLPKDIGVVVNNVGTIYSIYDAVVNGKPLIDRVITVSGERSENYGNFRVKIGTPVSHILKSQGNDSIPNDGLLVLGGPMMGKNIINTSVPITKGSSGVLFLQKKNIERSNCIYCGYCADVCPMHLMPMKFAENYRLGKIGKLEKYSLASCIECAACEYICPSNVPLVESIKNGKQKLKTLLSNAN